MDNLSRYIFHSGIFVHADGPGTAKRYFTVHPLNVQYVTVLTALCNQQKEALILVEGTQRIDVATTLLIYQILHYVLKLSFVSVSDQVAVMAVVLAAVLQNIWTPADGEPTLAVSRQPLYGKPIHKLIRRSSRR